MAHQITKKDTMFSVAETPWHGLGVVLDNPPTVDEAIRLAGLDWTVRLEPIHATLPSVSKEGVWSYEVKKAPGNVVVRNDDGTILGTVGNGFTPLQNRDALKWFQPWLDSGKVQLETAGSLRGGKVVWALAKIVSDPIVVKGDDVVAKYVLISHGHDGRMAVSAGTTAIRVVCANTLSMALSRNDGGLFKISHTTNVVDRLAAVREAIEQMDARLNAQGEVYRKLAAVDVTGGDDTLVDFLGAVYRQSAVDVKKGRRLEAIRERFETGVGQDLPGAHGTLWGLLNALTEEVSHGGRGGVESRMSALAFGDAKKTIKRGTDVAYAMATRTFTVEQAMGEFSDAAVLAASSHPNAIMA